jgi:hypothetical protein
MAVKTGKLESRLRPGHPPSLDPNSYARPYAIPPGVPRDRVRAVEAAFLKTLKDPEFVAEAEKTRMTVNPIPGTTHAQHDRRRLVHARGAQRKTQADPRTEGLAGEPVACASLEGPAPAPSQRLLSVMARQRSPSSD